MRCTKKRQTVVCPDDITEERARAVCEAIIEQARKDYQTIPNDAPSHDARAEARKNWRSARRFFFTERSNFPWMAKGLGIDARDVRNALRKRGQVKSEDYALQRQKREPGLNYGSANDRAARLLA